MAPQPLSSVAASPFYFAVSVADVERSVGWYERVLGFEVERSTDVAERGLKIRLLRSETGWLELIEDRSAKALAEVEPAMGKRYHLHGVFKFGFLVEDLDRAIERLTRLEVPLRGDVVSEPGLRSLQIEDPDGNVIQLFERVDSSSSGS